MLLYLLLCRSSLFVLFWLPLFVGSGKRVINDYCPDACKVYSCGTCEQRIFLSKVRPLALPYPYTSRPVRP